MRIPKWTVPILLRFLSLTGLTSASGTGGDLRIGLSLSGVAASPAERETLSQPRPQDFSLDLNLFVQVANHELKVPIMPLHLLGKKSWNVYNQDNIERVRRDEAAAKAVEEAEEQRMQEADAERRMQILRGEIPTPLQIEDKPDDGLREGRPQGEGSQGLGRERKRRKKAGEDDTDFEMRLAYDQSASLKKEQQIVLRKPIDAPLVDHSGHIDLFPQERNIKAVEKNIEAEKEAAKKKKEYEDQFTMRFSNAAGFKQGLENPWYSKPAAARDQVDEEIPSKDVWGNEDPRRKEREAARIVSSDPLAMMRQGAAQVRQVEKERKRWREEKEKEIRELVDAKERRRKRKRGYGDDGEDFENFKLDQPDSRAYKDHDRERRNKRRHRESRQVSHREQSSRQRRGHRDRHHDD